MLLLILTLLTVQSSMEEFRAIRAFRCDFPEGVGRISKGGGISSPSTPEGLSGVFTHSIDYAARTALASDEKRTSAIAVAVTPGERSTSFLMVSVDGNPMLQTIFALPLGATTTDGRTKYLTALSRHVAAKGDARADQLYGTCEAVKVGG